MITVKTELRGWADDWEGNLKIKFVLQLALHNTKGGCSWIISVWKEPSVSSYVNKPWHIEATAKISTSRGYQKGRIGPIHVGWEQCTFSFDVPQLTKAAIYEAAVKALKKTKTISYEVPN